MKPRANCAVLDVVPRPVGESPHSTRMGSRIGGGKSRMRTELQAAQISRQSQPARGAPAVIPSQMSCHNLSDGSKPNLRTPTQSGQQFEVMRTAFRRNADSDSKLCGHFDSIVVMVSAMVRAGVRIRSAGCPHSVGIEKCRGVKGAEQKGP